MKEGHSPLQRWSSRGRDVSQVLIVRLTGILVDFQTAPTGEVVVRERPYAAEALSHVRHAGYAVVIIADVAHFPGDDSHAELVSRTTAALSRLDPDRTLIDYAVVCPKDLVDPLAFLHELEQETGRSIEGSWLIGDRESDVEAARALGFRAALVATQRGVATWDALPPDQRRAVGLRSSIFAEAARHVLLADGEEAQRTG